MEDHTDRMKKGAAEKWSVPPSKRKQTVNEEEGAVLGMDPSGPARPTRRQPTRSTVSSRVQAYAEQEFLSARTRVSPARQDQIPVSYDGDGKIRQDGITKRYDMWIDEHGEDLTKYAIHWFFGRVYLSQKDKTSFDFAPHSNLSQWMKTSGRRVINNRIHEIKMQEKIIRVYGSNEAFDRAMYQGTDEEYEAEYGTPEEQARWDAEYKARMDARGG